MRSHKPREPRIDDTPIEPAPVAPAFAGKWALVYTEPRKEAVAVADLMASGWPAFSPMQTIWVTRAHIKRRTHAALFPRYAFVGIADHATQSIKSCKGVAALLPMPVAPSVVYALSARQANGEFDYAKPEIDPASLYHVGQTVTILGKPARIVSVGKRIKALMSILGGETTVEVGLDALGAG